MSRTTSQSGHIFLSCGEASGDRYGAALITALHELDPSLRFSALGGPLLAEAGAEIVEPSSAIAVMGFGEVITALPAIWRARRRVWRHLRDGGVDLCVPIDFPGFNLTLAAHAHRRGIPVFYLIPPQLWAWGSWRLRQLRRDVDRVGTILPFETEFYRERGLEVLPLGHPLMDEYADFPCEKAYTKRERRLGDAKQPLTLGLLPGSRRQEVDRLLPLMQIVTQMFQATVAPRRVQTVVSAAPGLDIAQLISLVERGVSVSDQPLPQLLERLDLALVCSGTASLEVALAGVPHEIIYQTSRLSYWIAMRLVRVPRMGLANLILGEDMAREYLQDAATPLGLGRALARWVANQQEREQFQAQALRLRQLCGEAGVWERAAAAIHQFCCA